MHPRIKITKATIGQAAPLLVSALLVAFALSITAIAGATEGKTRPSAEVKKALVGTWRLTSARVRDQNGNVTGSLYEDPVGKVTFTRRGDVWAFIGQRHRTSPSDPQLWYTGTFEVRARAEEVVGHVRFSSIPQFQGADLVRHYTLRDDRLVLSFSPGPGLTAYVHFTRAH